MSPERMKMLHRWACGSDTGVSSKTIYAAALGVDEPSRDFDAPHDSDDFGRCYRLVEQFPELREVLPFTVVLAPRWAPVVMRWDELCELYRQKKHPQIYEILRRGADAFTITYQPGITTEGK